MKSAPYRARLALAAASLVAGAAGAQAASHGSPTLAELAGASQLVAHTRVVKVDHVLSTPRAGAPGRIPHTLVTFEVLDALAGSAAPTFTLRFVGGPDGMGRVLKLSDYPVFQVGDEDVLFIKGNGERGCALAGCIDGRFRLADGQVHNASGVPLTSVARGETAARGQVPAAFRSVTYPAPSFDALMQHPAAKRALAERGLTLEQARAQYVPRPIVMGVASSRAKDQAAEAGAPATRVSLAAFTAAVQQAGSVKGGTLRSANPEAAIPTPVMRAKAPAHTPAAAPTPVEDARDAQAARDMAVHELPQQR